MSLIKLHDKTFEPYVTAVQLQEIVARVADEIYQDLGDSRPVFVCILNGSFMFAADLVRRYKGLCELSFVKMASYEGTQSSGKIHHLIGLSDDLEGKDVVVVGRSNIVGKPVAALVLNNHGTVTICNSHTKNLADKTKNADILISAVGKPKFITEDMVKEGAVVIDVGINRVNGKLEGDVDFENVQKKASHITPVPGGVGALTVAMLLSNILKSFKVNRGII